MIKGLAERAEKIRAGGVDPHVDNMLRITNDGRKLALDMRLINPLAADDPNGKVAVCARNVFRIWEQTKEKRSAQLVFCDLSTPTTDGSFSVYDDLKKKLMDAGIPEEEIAFIHTADSEAKKKELFSKVRVGQVRVLLGSTAKMGAGTNVQDRLIALHDLDCPWRPSDLQQRLGRIVRQGNENEEVEIYRYVTEGTFDAYLYQLVENKQKFIAQIMTSKAPVRVADDVDETALSYSEIKALATGNPLIIEKCNLDMEVARLNMLKASHLNQVYALEELVYRKYPEEITRLTERIAGYEQDVALAAAHPKAQEGFCGMEVDGKHYTEKEDAGKAIIDVCTRMTGSDAVLLGQYRGFSMVLAYDGRSNEYLIKVNGYSFLEAMETISGRAAIPPPSFVPAPKEEKPKHLLLPQAAPDNRAMMAYLKGRGIDQEILDYCVQTGRIYESRNKGHSNVVFVGFDKDGKARFGCLRGISEARFHGDLSGSDKHFSFALPACVENPAVHLCECAIDVMSYATLCKLDGIDWRRHNLLSLAGVYQPKKKIEESKLPVALTRFLEDHPHVKTIYLHLDNDTAGRLAAKAIMAVMPEGYRVENKPPPRGKDVNDFLCHRLGIPIRGSHGKEPER